MAVMSFNNNNNKLEIKLMTIKQKFANYLGYTDINPYEVIKVISDKCIEIREMSAEKIKWDMKIYQGGFSHHVANQDDQKWNITSNEANPIVRIRLNKSGQQYDHATRSYKPCYTWKDKYGSRYGLSDKPIKFYDYNF